MNNLEIPNPYPVRSKIKPETKVVLEILGVTEEEFILKRNKHIHDVGVNNDLSYKNLWWQFRLVGISLQSIKNLFK